LHPTPSDISINRQLVTRHDSYRSVTSFTVKLRQMTDQINFTTHFTFSQPILPLAAPLMCPDCRLRLWRYINPLYLLTYLLKNASNLF